MGAFALLFATSIGRLIMVAVLTFTIAFTLGWTTRNRSCRAADASAQLAAANADLTIAKHAADDADTLAKANAAEAEKLRKERDDYVEQLKTRLGPACTLSDDDVRRLR